MKLAERIVADPEILGGKPVVAGTRISVEFVLGQLGRGIALDDVARDYALSREDILAAIRFAASAVGRDAYVALGR
ncbi:MAG: DUF433 domain-containing protein [Myxococcota bacterium]